MQSSQKPLFGLYIHWPYCLSKCPYCDFASGIAAHIDEEKLLSGYRRDLDNVPSLQKCLTSLYFGGGTPSMMSPSFLKTILHEIKKRFKCAPDIDITLEANPDAIDPEKMAAFAALGVNRLSIGVQALNDKDLLFLGRRHTVQSALEKIKQAKKYFPKLNMDLIYARPGQTLVAWRDELNRALDLGLDHYSLYQLTIEPGTLFYKRAVQTPDDNAARDFYLMTDDIMNHAGIPGYEVSNYAKPGHESRHNLTYWTGGDYIGIGPAAHGRLNGRATQNEKSVLKWLKTPATYTPLSASERLTERVLMGLRLRKHPFGLTGLSARGIQTAQDRGWIKVDEQTNTLLPTVEGTLMLDSLILLLLPD